MARRFSALGTTPVANGFSGGARRRQRSTHATRGMLAATILACVAALVAAPSATADAPAPSWSNERILTCDGETVHTFLTPAGFGTPFNVVGETDVIIPKYVEVVFTPGTSPVVTLQVPGFDRTAERAVHCTYVDPVGLAVDFWGLRS